MKLASLFNSKIESIVPEQNSSNNKISALDLLNQVRHEVNQNNNEIVNVLPSNPEVVKDFLANHTKKQKNEVEENKIIIEEQKNKVKNNIINLLNDKPNVAPKKKPEIIEKIVENIDGLKSKEYKLNEPNVSLEEVKNPALIIGRGSFNINNEAKPTEVVKYIEVEKQVYIEKIDDSLKQELEQVKELNTKYLNVINKLNDELLVVKVTDNKKLVNNSELDTLRSQVAQLTNALNYVNNVNRALNQRMVRAI